MALNGTIVPLYTYPTDSSWTAIVTAKNAHPTVPVIAIVNPNSGPDVSINSDYTSGIAALRAAGIIVIGYIHTSYSAIALATAKGVIDTWKSFYAIDGIFSDEMNNTGTSGDIAYYNSLDDYAKSKGYSITVGNPGSDTSGGYVGTYDVLCIYEGGGVPTTSQVKGGSPGATDWHLSYARSNFAVLAYNVPSNNDTFIQTNSPFCGYFYITNDTLTGGTNNPWDSLSSYFSSTLASLETFNGTQTAPPPSGSTGGGGGTTGGVKSVTGYHSGPRAITLNGGTTILGHLSATKTWDPASVADGAMTSTTITVTGAALGDVCDQPSFSLAVAAGAFMCAHVTATDTVTVTLFNKSGGALDLASGTLRVGIWKH